MPQHSPDYSNHGQQAIEMRLKHYDIAYKLTNQIVSAISRCGLDGQYWFSTKDDSGTAVLHTEEHYYEAPTQYVADLLNDINDGKEFIALVESSMTRGTYPWFEKIEGGGDND
jgi:hypothetical protein